MRDIIEGVVVTVPVPDCRVKLGAQVAQLLAEHGLGRQDKWAMVILVGTKYCKINSLPTSSNSSRKKSPQPDELETTRE